MCTGNSLSRQRSRILIRLHNNNSSTHEEKCVHDLFQGYSYGDSLTLLDIQKALSLGNEKDVWMNTLQSWDSIPSMFQVSDVIKFLATGEIPSEWKYDTRTTRLSNITIGSVHPNSSNKIDSENSVVVYKDDAEKLAVESPVPKKSILKRHETIINERIVRTVTFENGVRKERVETDKTQSDKIKMETDEDEFAIREFTQQEQTEEENGNNVAFIRATEEFIHLKSSDDEFEYLHSDIPINDSEDEYSSSDDSIGDEDEYI